MSWKTSAILPPELVYRMIYGATNKWQSDHNQNHWSKKKKQTTPSPLLSGFSLSTIYNLKFVYIRLFRILRFCLANACFMASQYMFPHSFCFPRYTRVSHNLIQFSQYDRCCSPIYKINYNYIQLIVVT